MTWPVWTVATVPWGFPKAPHIPVWNLTPAQDNILLMQLTEGVELYFAERATFVTVFHYVLVGTNMGNLQGSSGELFILIWHHVTTEWKLTHFCLLLPQVKDVDLGIRVTLAEARLWVGIVLTILVTLGSGRCSPWWQQDLQKHAEGKEQNIVLLECLQT